MTIPQQVRDFPSLVRWLIETRHEGVAFRLAQQLQISDGTVTKWLRGTTKAPTVSLLTQLAEAYRLNLTEVIRLAARRFGAALLTVAIAGVLSLLAPHTSEATSVKPTESLLIRSWRRWISLDNAPAWA